MMLRIVEQTREEKIAMYMKLKKRDLASMLAERDRLGSPCSTVTIEPSETFPAFTNITVAPGTNYTVRW